MMRASPPASESRAICGGRGLPSSCFSPARTKAMVRPSGDQRGLESCLPLVSRIGESPPLVEVIQIEVSYPVRLSSTTTRVKTTRELSDETCGSVTQTKSNRSFSVIERFTEVEFCAETES